MTKINMTQRTIKNKLRIPLEQVGPVKSRAHLQYASLSVPTTHVPPLRHGFTVKNALQTDSEHFSPERKNRNAGRISEEVSLTCLSQWAQTFIAVTVCVNTSGALSTVVGFT
jgi:hypothetical protein